MAYNRTNMKKAAFVLSIIGSVFTFAIAAILLAMGFVMMAEFNAASANPDITDAERATVIIVALIYEVVFFAMAVPSFVSFLLSLILAIMLGRPLTKGGFTAIAILNVIFGIFACNLFSFIAGILVLSAKDEEFRPAPLL